MDALASLTEACAARHSLSINGIEAKRLPINKRKCMDVENLDSNVKTPSPSKQEEQPFCKKALHESAGKAMLESAGADIVSDTREQRKGVWLEKEDHLLKKLVGEYGACGTAFFKLSKSFFSYPSHSSSTAAWTKIAQHIDGRVGKQCRERWCNHLDPKIKKGAYTEEEDLVRGIYVCLRRCRLIAHANFADFIPRSKTSRQQLGED
jgi:hypothetical protein